MKEMTYICSPYHAETDEEFEKHIEYAQELTRQVLLNREFPVTVHLYMTQCLREEIVDERNIGLNAGKEILKHCGKMLVGCRCGISEGMKMEIELAERYGTEIEYTDKKEEQTWR